MTANERQQLEAVNDKIDSMVSDAMDVGDDGLDTDSVIGALETLSNLINDILEAADES